MSLNEIIKEFLLEKGAIKVGFANKETLAGGPPRGWIIRLVRECRD